MADKLSIERRSWNMSRLRSKDTGPEMRVRRLVHSLGYRFRLHRKDLPGRPDLVFPGRHKVIQVHGFFWHGHECNEGVRKPGTNTSYSQDKIEKNRKRDQQPAEGLRALGWRVLTLWECELANPALSERIVSFLQES
jgi:DNA mismatch endonuclease (patch repair protein)